MDPVTGMVIDVVELKNYMSAVIDKTLDHKNIDLDVPYFEKKVSTLENITVYIWEEMKKLMKNPDILYEVKVYESEEQMAMYRGEKE